MIRTRLSYHRPVSLDEASALLAAHTGNVAVLGGGTQLLPQMHRDEVHVEHVVDLRGLGLDTITVDGEQVEIGAMVTYADVLLSPALRGTVPLLPRAAREVTGGRQLVQQATLVGSACHNAPGSDMPGVLVALDARMRLHGTGGPREVAARDFLLDASRVDLRPGEFVTSFVVGRTMHVGYCKVKHSTGSWPIATASVLRHPGGGSMTVTLGAVQAVPLRIEIDDPDRLEDGVPVAGEPKLHLEQDADAHGAPPIAGVGTGTWRAGFPQRRSGKLGTARRRVPALPLAHAGRLWRPACTLNASGQTQRMGRIERAAASVAAVLVREGAGMDPISEAGLRQALGLPRLRGDGPGTPRNFSPCNRMGDSSVSRRAAGTMVPGSFRTQRLDILPRP